VWESTLRTPSGTSTPSNVDSALDAFFLSASCWIVHTTSSAVIGWPLWNFTPWRSENVHSLPSELDVHLLASIGCSCSAWLLSKARNSPVWASMHRPPESSTVSGLTAPAGTWLASRSVPPLATGADVVEEPDDDAAAPVLFALPQAARTAPMTPVDMPTTAPRRRNWRRLTRPATSSSM